MNGCIIDLQFNTKSICDTGSLHTDSGACGDKDMYMPTTGVAAFLQPRTATPSLRRHTQAAHEQPAGKCAGTSARAACVGRAALAHARVPPSIHPKTQEQQGNRATPSRRPQTDMVGLKEYLKEQKIEERCIYLEIKAPAAHLAGAVEAQRGFERAPKTLVGGGKREGLYRLFTYAEIAKGSGRQICRIRRPNPPYINRSPNIL
ncbi:hypothetical protein C8R44DRAFT_743879 [Mycena epipterygia]|nr:hypothetical protein C8R44DRAFT_743879 [Mycena epipterygia]